MRDYNYVDDEGRRVPVAGMRTETIVGILLDGGVHIVDDDGYGDVVENVLERLRIELTARELEGRL